MINFKITYSDRFKKNYKKLSNIEKKQVKNKLTLFTQNPTHPSLRTKKIKGVKNTWESSINMDIRVIWIFENEKYILLLDIGHHDIFDRF